MTYTVTFLLHILFGMYGIDGGDASYKQTIANDPAIAPELGIDLNCLDCNTDAVKAKMLDLQALLPKDGGITGDDLAGN